MKRSHIQTVQGLQDFITQLTDKYPDREALGEFGIILELKTGIRTTNQNSAMHVYFSLLADAFNDAGLDMKKVLKPDVSIPWTPVSVKEHLWRPVMVAVTEKHSTRELERSEVSAVYEPLHRHIASKFGVMVPFPDRFNR
jgi:hypothetical protein